MRAYDIVKSKRDGAELGAAELRFMVNEYTRGKIPDCQMSAFLMAIFLRGLTPKELSAFTHSMLHSGSVINLSDIPLPKIDKHSTGGVGDKVSICLAPLVAACGVAVPMISGRGLGHTGGTLDKLESIPGFKVDIGVDEFHNIVKKIGICLTGQTRELAPADRKIYALRDVTATVESIPLIASSIMCKKLAEGIDGLVLDVKVGNGAFMKKLSLARKLARTMVRIGNSMGKKVRALITDMNQPLGHAVGNSVEVIEAFEVLKGKGPDDLERATVELGAHMLLIGGVARGVTEAKRKIRSAISNGAGIKKMRQCIKAQGGNPRVLDDYAVFGASAQRIEVKSPKAGYVSAIDTETVGRAAMLLGAGREKTDSEIESSAGIMIKKKISQPVKKDEPLAEIFYSRKEKVKEVGEMLLQAFTISIHRPSPPKLIVDVI